MLNSKACTVCKQTLSIEEFNKRPNQGTLGYTSACKYCLRAQNAVYRANNRDKEIQRNKNYYWANVSRLLDYKFEYYWDNVEVMRLIARNRTPEQRRQMNKAYAARHPEVIRSNSSKRKARIRNAGLFKIAPKDFQKLIASPCFYCGKKDNIHIDHIVPIARGGRHSIGNLMTLCQKCNLQKGTKTWFEFKLWKAQNA